MIFCPACKAPLDGLEAACLNCGFHAQIIDGFLAFAPDLAKEYEGFPTDGFSCLADSEASSFWFEARNDLILWALTKHFPDFSALLEIGCGTGYVLSAIAQRFPTARLVGSEILTAGLVHAQQRLPQAQLIQMDARKMPFQSEFDVVAAFDVIEHVQEDKLVLANLFRAIKPGGGCLITVPQHQWLWSLADEQACHVRRYDAAALHKKIETAGFSILRSTSFVSLLLPAMVLSRWSNRRDRAVVAEKEFQLNTVLNAVLKKIMDVERVGIRLGINLPWGGSRLVIGQKPEC
jgi:ubiquinone/menaquinone biosynthesis C-methylase UbiE